MLDRIRCFIDVRLSIADRVLAQPEESPSRLWHVVPGCDRGHCTLSCTLSPRTPPLLCYAVAMAQAKNRRGTALSVKLPIEMAQAVYQQVRDGNFDTAGGVIRAALCSMLGLDAQGNALSSAADDAPRRKPKRGRRGASGAAPGSGDDDLE